VVDYLYFLEGPHPDSAHLTGHGKGLIRLEDDAPWDLAEFIAGDGTWAETDVLGRRHFLGSSDVQITEVTPERAREIVVAWHHLKRIENLPHPLPGNEVPESPPRKYE
jgi:hypothetical protein